MNRFKKYSTSNISFEEINQMESDYLSQVNNGHLKKVEIKIKNDNIILNVEPYNTYSDKWDILIEKLKNKKMNFWFRDDDAGIDNESLIFLMQYMQSKKINIFIAAIPKLANIDLQIKLSKFNNFYIGQHGYWHKNYSETEKAEYTETRNKHEVKEELIEGNSILQDMFGDKYLKVFIPPWFEIDTATKELLKDLEYKALSNYWNNKINIQGLIEANCKVDFVNWDNAYTFGGDDFVLQQIINQIDNSDDQDYIGLLLHHERVGKETYDFLDKLISILQKYSKILNIKDVISSIEVNND